MAVPYLPPQRPRVELAVSLEHRRHAVLGANPIASLLAEPGAQSLVGEQASEGSATALEVSMPKACC